MSTPNRTKKKRVMTEDDMLDLVCGITSPEALRRLREFVDERLADLRGELVDELREKAGQLGWDSFAEAMKEHAHS